MALKNYLNQYELDIVQAPLRNKKIRLSYLKDMTIAVAGDGDLLRAVVYSFLYCIEELSLNARLIVVTESEFAVPAGVGDLDVRTPDMVDDPVDYWVETRFFEAHEDLTADEFCRTVDRVSKACALLGRLHPARTVLLADTLCYGYPDNKNMALSENEYVRGGFAPEHLRPMLSQTVENLFADAAHQYGFDTVTLRSACLIAPFGGLELTERYLRRALDGEDICFKLHGRRTSYVFISDLITAIFYILIYKNAELGSAYNVCGDEATLSPAMLAAITDECFPSTNISLSEDGLELSGCAVSAAKLKAIGWKPLVSVRDALITSERSLSGSEEIFTFTDSYDGKLKAIQSVLLGFLKEVDRICRKHDIKYFLGGGSLLGAIRHKGFIPWDDDADIMMLREDYDHFLSVLPQELPGYVFNQRDEKTSHFAFTKLRLDDTLLSTRFTAKFDDIHNGVFVDILAQDKTADSPLRRRIHMKMTGQLRWLVLHKWEHTPVKARKGVKSMIANCLKAMLPLSLLERLQNRVMARYKNKDTHWLFDSMGRNLERGAFPAEWLSEAVYVYFEDTMLPIPKEWDKYLTYLYGDYESMITLSERHVSHSIVRIDLGKYINF